MSLSGNLRLQIIQLINNKMKRAAFLRLCDRTLKISLENVFPLECSSELFILMADDLRQVWRLISFYFISSLSVPNYKRTLVKNFRN